MPKKGVGSHVNKLSAGTSIDRNCRRGRPPALPNLSVLRRRANASAGTKPARPEPEFRDVTIRKADGFALIDVIFVCGIIGLISGIALPRLVLASQAADAASAIGTMRSIASAELTFALTCGSGFYAPNLRTLGTPPPSSNEPYISPGMGASNMVQHSGYTFRVDAAPYGAAPASCNGLGAGQAGQGFVAAADPTEPTNFRFLGVNATAQIFEFNSTLWDDMPEYGDPPIGAPIR
jgi:type II secretory pathway pseudopilin PulG